MDKDPKTQTKAVAPVQSAVVDTLSEFDKFAVKQNDFKPLEEGVETVTISKFAPVPNKFAKTENDPTHNLEWTLERADKSTIKLWTSFTFSPAGKNKESKLYSLVSKASGLDFSNYETRQSFFPSWTVFEKNLKEVVVGKRIQIVVEKSKNDKGEERSKIVSFLAVKG